MGVEVSEVINILGERYNRVFQGAGSALPEPWIDQTSPSLMLRQLDIIYLLMPDSVKYTATLLTTLLKVWSTEWNISTIWELDSNAESQAPLQTYRIRICTSNRFPSDS